MSGGLGVAQWGRGGGLEADRRGGDWLEGAENRGGSGCRGGGAGGILALLRGAGKGALRKQRGCLPLTLSPQ